MIGGLNDSKKRFKVKQRLEDGFDLLITKGFNSIDHLVFLVNGHKVASGRVPEFALVEAYNQVFVVYNAHLRCDLLLLEIMLPPTIQGCKACRIRIAYNVFSFTVADSIDFDVANVVSHFHVADQFAELVQIQVTLLGLRISDQVAKAYLHRVIAIAVINLHGFILQLKFRVHL